MKIAVILFAYNRPRYLKRALKTHKKIDGLSYYAFVDYSDKQDEVADLIPDYYQVIKRESHYGLDKNITEGTTESFMFHDAVIVLEDDLLLKKGALEYLADRLVMFRHRNEFGSVSLFKGKFRNEQFMCLGWGTWKDRWQRFEYIKGEGTQAQQFDKFHKDNGLYCVCSPKWRVRHIWGEGTHTRALDIISIRRIWTYHIKGLFK
ncbi:MAG: hypothetical protein GY804_09955 [Alphaproteobacteria bacterium]|nr:hypothetical protein [Alphaproteobacteria bacterium]